MMKSLQIMFFLYMSLRQTLMSSSFDQLYSSLHFSDIQMSSSVDNFFYFLHFNISDWYLSNGPMINPEIISEDNGRVNIYVVAGECK